MVNIFTEWDELQEVIVGSLGNFTEIYPDESFCLAFQDNFKNVFMEKSFGLQKHVIEQRQNDLNDFANVLIGEGITVHRPLIPDCRTKIQTPVFSENLNPCVNPRDQFLVIGNEIIETSCQWRRRYFENDLLKPILYKKFREGAKWTCAPRPIMTKNSFDLHNVLAWGGDHAQGWEESPDELEIMFDGAQCLKFGKDIVMNVKTKNHKLGYDWLKRHLGERFRLHMVHLTDNHIDAMIMPLAPGKLLINSGEMRDKVHMLPAFLQKWDIITSPVPHEDKLEGTPLASQHININVLSLSPKKVVIFDGNGGSQNPLGDILTKHNFEVCPIRLRHGRLFDGGAHCATLDLVRKGDLVDYT